MLSVLRWFVGCWHEWGRWENITITSEFGPESGQTRYCKKCGRRSTRGMGWI